MCISPGHRSLILISSPDLNMRQRFFGSRWWKRKLTMYGKANKRVEMERRKEKESEDRERRQRYKISEELKNENIEMEIKKRRKKKRG